MRRYEVWQSANNGEYERLQYVVFRHIDEARRFVRQLQESARLYLGLHPVVYDFEIRRAD